MSKQIAMTGAVDFRPTFLRNAMERIATRRARNKVYRNTLAELSQLSDRELADLGMARGDLRGVAMEAAQSEA